MREGSDNWRPFRTAIDDLIVSQKWSRQQAEEWINAAVSTGKVHQRTRTVEHVISIGSEQFRLTAIDDYSAQPAEIVEIDISEVLQALEGAPTPKPSIIPTGMPGRPSKGKDLILAELERRIAEKTCERTVRAEAAELKVWFARTYPNAQQPTIKTIENNIRAEYRRSEETFVSE